MTFTTSNMNHFITNRPVLTTAYKIRKEKYMRWWLLFTGYRVIHSAGCRLGYIIHHGNNQLSPAPWLGRLTPGMLCSTENQE